MQSQSVGVANEKGRLVDETTPTSLGIVEDADTDQLCDSCGGTKMDRLAPAGSDRLLSWFCIYPFGCRKCCRIAHHFFLGLRFWVEAILLLFLISGVWAYNAGMLPHLQVGPASTHEAALEGVRANAGQLSPFEKMMVSKHQQTLSNATVVELSRSGISAPVILKMIRNSNHDFDVSAASIIQLKKAGVDESIIYAMLDSSPDSR